LKGIEFVEIIQTSTSTPIAEKKLQHRESNQIKSKWHPSNPSSTQQPPDHQPRPTRAFLAKPYVSSSPIVPCSFPSSSTQKAKKPQLLLNNFQPSTWLLTIAALQGILTWLFPAAFKFTVIPALLILLYRAIDVLLIMSGVKRNPAMDGIIREKFSAQIPFEDGSFGERPSRDKVTVLILGSKSNQYVLLLAGLS
jgi:hypothetical protein